MSIETREDKAARIGKLSDAELDAEIGIKLFGMNQFIHEASGQRVITPFEATHFSTKSEKVQIATEDIPLYKNYYGYGLSRFVHNISDTFAVVRAMQSLWVYEDSDGTSLSSHYWQFVDCYPVGWRVDIMFSPENDAPATELFVSSNHLGRAICEAALLML